MHGLPKIALGRLRVVAAVLAVVVFDPFADKCVISQEISLADFFAIESPADRRFEKQITATWDGVPLGEVAQRLTNNTDVAIWIDRRVDHTKPVQLSVNAMPLSQVLDNVAELEQLEARRIGPLLYISTEQRIARLRIAIAASRQLALTSYRELAEKQDWKWNRFTTPTELIDQILNDSELQASGIELVPHDLLAARSMANVSRADLLTLLLFGFDLTWNKSDTKLLSIERLADTSTVDRRYSLDDRHREKMLVAAKVLGENAQRRGSDLWIRASMAEHESFAFASGLLSTSVITSRPRPAADMKDRRFTLRVRDQPASFVIEQLATQLGAKVDKSRLDTKADIDTFADRISFDLKTATIDELLSEIASQAGVTIERRGTTWNIAPR